MNDLHLWRLLRSKPLPVGDIVPLLHDLAAEPLWARLPFLGFLGPLLRHGDAKVRCAALTALGGAHGYLAHRFLIEALDDPETREAALAALRGSIQELNSSRWVHALFHPDPAVRRAAVDPNQPWPASVPWHYVNHFLHDPANADLARTWLVKHGHIPDENGNFAAPEETPLPHTVPPTKPFTPEQARLISEVETALDNSTTSPAMATKIEAYLALGTAIPFFRRSQAAWALRNLGLPFADFFPLFLQNEWHPDRPFNEVLQDPSMLACLEQDAVAASVKSVLMADLPMPATELDSEFRLLDLLHARLPEEPAVQDALALILTFGKNSGARREARDKLQPDFGRSIRLNRLARAFAWGMRLGRALTGHPYRIEMISNEQLGYTRFTEEKLYISPMPILRDEPDGEAVVRGLILHEYGHHLFHKSDQALEIWDKADKSGLGKLLNLVADEHLERNLRQLNPDYGHLLKRLCSFAFQFRRREIPVDTLLNFLGDGAFEVLSQIRLRTARDPQCVLVQNGRLMRAMELRGVSFARFIRALRMGMGNRYGDPKVKEALALFRGGFRRSDMAKLLEIATRLREIFGEETQLLDWMNQDECLRWPNDEDLPTRDELQKALGQLPGAGGPGKQQPRGLPTAWGINLDPNVQFNRIKDIVRLQHDPARHADYARKIAREAQLLRRWLEDLGLGFVPQAMRTQGRRLDRGRTLPLVLHNDPRVLIRRQLQRRTDLFVGVLIDCSSSMAGERIEKAKTFGTLLAEAVKNQRGIDLRLFGFTEMQIFDAGTARRCAVHALNAWGGNNDAAALQHAFECAQASPRKAKLLIMISDGLPTNCSVAALQHLVQRLTRRRYCCAQVAVAPLEQMCFPHYILLDDAHLAESVQKFGAVVRRLVQEALGVG